MLAVTLVSYLQEVGFFPMGFFSLTCSLKRNSPFHSPPSAIWAYGSSMSQTDLLTFLIRSKRLLSRHCYFEMIIPGWEEKKQDCAIHNPFKSHSGSFTGQFLFFLEFSLPEMIAGIHNHVSGGWQRGERTSPNLSSCTEDEILFELPKQPNRNVWSRLILNQSITVSVLLSIGWQHLAPYLRIQISQRCGRCLEPLPDCCGQRDKMNWNWTLTRQR